jgi:extracellular elastinolytic metalloproteinase
LTGPNAGDPLDIALTTIDAHQATFGLSDADLGDVRVTDRYTSAHNGITHLYLRQRYAGIEVYNANINVNIAADGSVINLSSSFVPGLAKAINTTTPTLSAEDAVTAASQDLGLKLTAPVTAQETSEGPQQSTLLSNGGISQQPIPARLMYQPLANGAVRLAWDLAIYELNAQHWWSLRVDAVDGRVLDKLDLVVHDTFPVPAADRRATPPIVTVAPRPPASPLTPDQYRVFAMPVESPSHGSRSPVTDPADLTASPFGWHDTNGAAGAEYTTTQGNNVHAYTDTDSSNSPDVGGSPSGGASLVFDFALDLAQAPSTYRPAAVTNLFYWNNTVHDVFYRYGFDEAGGNFQENNYGRGGAGSDYVYAEAQDGGGTNNANFATPADGNNPRMQMYLWNYTTPFRDGDLDNGIIVHEYGHGISNRLTGGPSNVSCLGNQEQPGEGWSDWLSLMLTIESGDHGTDTRGIGTYALGQPTTGTGIRTYPYSTNMGIDPRTYDTIKTAAVPHGVGSVWAAMLWEVTWALIDEYGLGANVYDGTGGNNKAIQLVIDGMKLQPCSPGFVDARNAILQADQVDYGGANQCLLWEAFAKRGLGYSASQGSSNNRSDGTQAFDLPLACQQALRITKNASPSPVTAGENLTYSLLVENDTPNQLTGVTVTDSVPQNTTYVENSATCDGSLAGGVVTFNLGTMAAHTSRTCTFQVTVSPGLGTIRFFLDGMESGSAPWTATAGQGTYNWSLGTTNAHSPTHAWYAQDVTTVSDQYLAMTNAVNLSGSSKARVWHNYSTETGWDGGVLEISLNGGAWTDLGSKLTQNGYNGTLNTGSPLGGRQAFTGSSGGYKETLADLSSYAGSSARVRFRFATDTSVGATGWYVDDVEIVDEDTVSNTACVTANEGNNDCDTVATVVMPGSGGTPNVGVSPASLAATLYPNQTANQNLTVSNTGSADLNWDVTESADACSATTDLSWVSAAPASGTTAASANSTVVATFDSTGLSGATYSGSLCVTSNDPDTPLVVIPLSMVVETPPSSIDHLATSDIPGSGTVAGTYANTHSDDDVTEAITEILSGGKPASRYDLLQHTWTLQVQAGTAHTFFVNAWRTVTADNDAFKFAYSTDGTNFVDMLTVSATSDGTTHSFTLPPGLSGTVYVRVADTNHTAGQRNLDTVYVDRMVIVTQTGTQTVGTVTGVVRDSATTDRIVGATVSADTGQTTTTDGTGGYTLDNVPIGDRTIIAAATGYTTQQQQTTVVENGTSTVDFNLVALPRMHIGALTGSTTPAASGRWNAIVTIRVVDTADAAVAGATVSGTWSAGATGSDTCATDATGVCSVTKTNLKSNVASVTWTVTGVTKTDYIYDASANTATVITVLKP